MWSALRIRRRRVLDRGREGLVGKKQGSCVWSSLSTAIITGASSYEPVMSLRHSECDMRGRSGLTNPWDQAAMITHQLQRGLGAQF